MIGGSDKYLPERLKIADNSVVICDASTGAIITMLANDTTTGSRFAAEIVRRWNTITDLRKAVEVWH